MNLFQYLLAIQANKAINLRRFLSLLPASYQHNWRDIFASEKVIGQDKHKLIIIDKLGFDEMLAKQRPSQSRTGAALLGDSHQHNTSMSYLLVYPNVLVNPANHVEKLSPKVVLIDDI